MRGEMTHKERIIAAIEHKETDRVPTDYWGVEEVTQKLFEHYNVGNMVALAEAMDIDKIINVAPKLIADRPNMLGLTMKKIPLQTGIGFYEEPEFFPLSNCETIKDVENCGYEFPSVDMYDYSVIYEQCREAEGFAIEGGYISLTFFYTMIRGTENMLMDFIANKELAKYILFKLQEFSYQHTKKILEAGEGRIDITQVTDDFGSQNGLLFSKTMIDEYLSDYYDANVKLVKSYNSHVFHHDDGAMCDALPWLKRKGIELLNPLQWHLPGWNLEQLKADYGKTICFHGGIDNQYVLPFGTEEELDKEIKTCIDILYKDNTGYILAPCHNVQAITSIERVIKMFDIAKSYGVAK